MICERNEKIVELQQQVMALRNNKLHIQQDLERMEELLKESKTIHERNQKAIITAQDNNRECLLIIDERNKEGGAIQPSDLIKI